MAVSSLRPINENNFDMGIAENFTITRLIKQKERTVLEITFSVTESMALYGGIGFFSGFIGSSIFTAAKVSIMTLIFKSPWPLMSEIGKEALKSGLQMGVFYGTLGSAVGGYNKAKKEYNFYITPNYFNQFADQIKKSNTFFKNS